MSEETEVGGGDATVAPLRRRPGPGGPRKRANATTNVSADDFNDDDEVTNLKAVKLRLAEMLSRPDLLERDLSALSKDYRKVIVELKEAQLRADAAKLGTGPSRGLRAVSRSFDGDI